MDFDLFIRPRGRKNFYDYSEVDNCLDHWHLLSGGYISVNIYYLADGSSFRQGKENHSLVTDVRESHCILHDPYMEN